MRVGQYLWHTIQAHRVMTQFQEMYFHQYTSIPFSVVNLLFGNRAAKFDVEVLNTKFGEQDNILTKQAKDIKHMKSKLCCNEFHRSSYIN